MIEISLDLWANLLTIHNFNNYSNDNLYDDSAQSVQAESKLLKQLLQRNIGEKYKIIC